MITSMPLLFPKRTGGFRNKVVVITGSSKGIGKAIAMEFLKAGARVVINGRNPVALQATADEFQQMGFNPLAVAGDMSDFSACHELIRKTMEHFMQIDILVNNAGGGFRGTIEETEPDVLKYVIDLNLMSSLYCTKAALDPIKATRGSIVFISALIGLRGIPMNGPYCIAKMGLTALAQTLKLELHGTGVHIGILMVGLTDYDKDKKVIAADGSLIPIQRSWHHTRQQVANKVLKMITKRKFMLILTPLGKIESIMQRISPSFVEWIIRKYNKEDFNR